MGCLICKKIEMIKNGTNPYFVKELDTSYVMIGEYQHFYGYTILICKEHYGELLDMPKDFRMRYLEDMDLTAQAVKKAFEPERIDYELLGTLDGHACFSIFPRNTGDSKKEGSVWLASKDEMFDQEEKLPQEELASTVKKLKTQFEVLEMN